jgi:hypothetical protein
MFLNDIMMVNNYFTCSAAEKIIIETVNYFRIRIVLLAFLLLLLLFWN